MKATSSFAWRERLTSPLTWHYAGFALLLVLVIGLAVRFGLDWAATNSRSSRRAGRETDPIEGA